MDKKVFFKTQIKILHTCNFSSKRINQQVSDSFCQILMCDYSIQQGCLARHTGLDGAVYRLIQLQGFNCKML